MLLAVRRSAVVVAWPCGTSVTSLAICGTAAAGRSSAAPRSQPAQDGTAHGASAASGVSGLQGRPHRRRLQHSRSPAHAATAGQRVYPSGDARPAWPSAAPPHLERDRRRRRRRRRRGTTATATATATATSDGDRQEASPLGPAWLDLCPMAHPARRRSRYAERMDIALAYRSSRSRSPSPLAFGPLAFVFGPLAFDPSRFGSTPGGRHPPPWRPPPPAPQFPPGNPADLRWHVACTGRRRDAASP